MSDARVGQLQRLHDITAEQLAAYPSRAIGVLGVAGGNGLDLITPETTDSVMSDAEFAVLGRCEYPLPNGKTLIRQDFRTT